MEKKKNSQMIIIVVLSIALLTMSVGFATYSADLLIEGSVNILPASWNVQIDADSYKESKDSTVSVGGEDRNITGTTMTYDVELNNPGDKYEFTIDVENTGTFDANLISILITTLSEDTSKYLKYTVEYDGNDSSLIKNVILPKHGGKATIKVTVEYILPEDLNDMPLDNKLISLVCTLNYVQV